MNFLNIFKHNSSQASFGSGRFFSQRSSDARRSGRPPLNEEEKARRTNKGGRPTKAAKALTINAIDKAFALMIHKTIYLCYKMIFLCYKMKN